VTAERDDGDAAGLARVGVIAGEIASSASPLASSAPSSYPSSPSCSPWKWADFGSVAPPYVGAVLEKPSKAGSNAETVVQGLAGRCCGYGKGAHAVRVVVQHSAAREYCYFWEDGVSVSKANNLGPF
jgi:hypothetical protein